ncbi:MAG TPA: uroporphyrinogen-III C-methyltransferase, partial [Rhizobiales bacterium]|nr:uroporphyrinogen-III C-methyltransferase [Hyphomicrobiales bacterium]
MSDPSTTLAKFPVFYSLAGKSILLAGDDAALIPKIRLIAMTGAHLHICAPSLKAAMEKLDLPSPQASKLKTLEQEWAARDFTGQALAIGAFVCEDEAARFQHSARRANVPVNLVDRPALCDFQIPVIVNRSPLIIGISTGGAAPVMGQWLRGRLESLLPGGTGRVLEAAASLRRAIRARLTTPAARRAFWKALAEQDLLHLARKDSLPEIKAILQKRLEKADSKEFGAGRVQYIQIPEHPEDMSLKTLSLLQNADVIICA